MSRRAYPPLPRPIESGDIILYPTSGRSGWTAKFVAIFEILLSMGRGLEMYSHVAISARRGGDQFEWRFPWSGFYPIDTSRVFEVWRIGSPTHEQRQKILEYCARHKGEWYNVLLYLTAGRFSLKHTAVCSQGVGRAYAHAGIRISAEGKHVLSPNAIADPHCARMLWRYTPPVEP